MEILGLSFTRPGWERNVSGPLIILIRKFPETMSGAIVKTMQGGKFISYADNLISAVTKNADKNSFPINTLLINNLRVREARFDWIDQKGNYKTSILMFFEPIQVGYKYIEIQVMFSDNSKDYSKYSSELERSLKNIRVTR